MALITTGIFTMYSFEPKNFVYMYKESSILNLSMHLQAVVAALPQHVKSVVLDAAVTREMVAALPQHVKFVDINPGVTREVVAALPQHVKLAVINPGVTREVVAALPQHVIDVSFEPGVPQEVQDARDTHNAEARILLSLGVFRQKRPSDGDDSIASRPRLR